MIRIIFFLLMNGLTLFALDFNSSISNGSPELYTQLLQKLSHSEKSNDEVNLQKTLLLKLKKITQEKLPAEDKIVTPSNQSDYMKLFDTYLQKSLDRLKLLDSSKINSNKLEALNFKIKDKNSTTLTTELFHTLYTKEQVKLRKQLELIQKESLAIEKTLFNSLPYIKFDTYIINNKERNATMALTQLESKLQQLRLKKERYFLLEQKNVVSQIEHKMQVIVDKKKKLNQQILDLLFLRFSIALQKKDTAAFHIHKEFLHRLSQYISQEQDVHHSFDMLFTRMEKQIFGTVASIKGKGVEEIQTQVENLWQIANQPLFTINKTKVSIFKLAISLLIFIIGFIVGNFYKRQIQKLSLKNRTITSSTRTLLSNLGYYLIFIITFFIVLKVLGINLGSIALVAGALSVGIGFGLQNIISNFVSGIILMVERSVRIGDYVELDNNLRGYIHDIRMRSVTIVTNENINIIVPNQKLIENNVINWTMNDNIRRFSIPFGVAYGTDAHRVIDLITEAVLESEYRADIVHNKKQQTSVIMTEMGDSSVNFELFVWVKGDNLHRPKRTASAFLVLIYDTLYENNIEIPFPQQDLHIRSVDTSLPITFTKTKDSL